MKPRTPLMGAPKEVNDTNGGVGPAKAEEAAASQPAEGEQPAAEAPKPTANLSVPQE